ncbi:Aminopeptidase N [Eumeta japonica]|uniref:Aminopeptidase N n=1 Tax=Eumeta variegata TaxID=151549 RepID=A0A4C1W5Y9_EUMVA|nr:Aminopeptidase N [Eumeta japonica]
MSKILILAAALFVVAATPLTNPRPSFNNEALSAQYRLSDNTIPTFYDVRLFLDPNADSFRGSVTIRVMPYVETDEIVLHAMDMTLSNINVRSDLNADNLYLSHTLATDDTHFLRIRLSQTLTAFLPYLVDIDYTAPYGDNMFGIYVSTYETATGDRRLVTSQLQPTFARRAFPCYDEPKFKAIFRTTIYAPAEFTAVRSNTLVRDDAGTWPDVPGYIKHEFEDTLPMSTYLVAYLVSDFDFRDNTENPIYRIPFRVYARPGVLNTADFALDFGQRNMVALEEYMQFPYYFEKMDKVAVPDFAFGAMENWGLVKYREVALLVQDGVTTTSTKQNVGRLICHENLHQWFGNEVSPDSWTYTWLNEGFANLFESYATDFVLSEWRMMDQFVLNMQNVFQSDAVLSVNPMTHPVYTPSEIIGTFNAVAYQKLRNSRRHLGGSSVALTLVSAKDLSSLSLLRDRSALRVRVNTTGSVIRMLEHFLTPEIFRRGLVIYIRDNARGVVTPAQLYTALQQAVNEANYSLPTSIEQILTAWTTQGGFPVITVRRSAPTANSVFITQERYLTDPTQSAPDRWRIPVNWVLSTAVDFSDTSPQAWVPHTFPAVSVDIPRLNETEWFIFNKQQTGYYRVNYDEENWQALSRVLNSDQYDRIHVLNRAQLIDDAFNLARNGRLDYRIPMELARYLVRESDYVPWAAASAAFTYLETVLSGSPAYEWFQPCPVWSTNQRSPFAELASPCANKRAYLQAFTNYCRVVHQRYIQSSHQPSERGDDVCAHSCVRVYKTEFLLELSLPLFDELGFDETQNEEHVTAFHRNIILGINCRHGNENCTSVAQDLLQEPESIHADIQTTVYCSGLRGGDAGAFNTLWNMFVDTTDSSRQSILLNALGCTSNSDRLQLATSAPLTDTEKYTVEQHLLKKTFSSYMDQVISDTSSVREQDRHTILVSVINAGPDNLEVALDFIIDNFLEIQQSVQGLTGTTNILNALSRTLSTKEHEEKIDNFYERYQNYFTAGEIASVAAIRENIGASQFWADRNFNVVEDWLRANYGNHAGRVTATVAFVLPLILSLLNVV